MYNKTLNRFITYEKQCSKGSRVAFSFALIVVGRVQPVGQPIFLVIGFEQELTLFIAPSYLFLNSAQRKVYS